MKKLLTLALAGTMCCTIGCTKAEAPKPESVRYVAKGHYYTNGTVITNDGNEWNYTTDTISNKPSYDHQAVNIGFDDNGTPDNITDDIILGLTWDIETSIYDTLETELSEEFEIERNGNNIKIGGTK